MDTLPFREGHADWLSQAIGFLGRDDTFSFGGALSLPHDHHPAWEGYYFCHVCSLNFALMKRNRFMDALHETANEYLLAGFKGENPATSWTPR